MRTTQITLTTFFAIFFVVSALTESVECFAICMATAIFVVFAFGIYYELKKLATEKKTNDRLK